MISRPAVRPSVEPLEDRIAPALLVNGANLLGGAGNPTTGETSVGDNSVTLVKVTSGQALVWFDDGNIYSISFGPNTSIEVLGDILGDVVGNLKADGTLSDSDNNPANGEDGAKLLANNLIGLKTSPLSGEKGSLGNIITGGSIANLSISGQVLGAYAGDGAFRAESDVLSVGGKVTSSVGVLDINPIVSGLQNKFDFTKATSALLPGASINTAKITLAPGLQLFAGSGNPTGTAITGTGPAGGNITFVTIESAVVPAGSAEPSYWLIAGDGADGDKGGGAGGFIDHIVEKASFGAVEITAGKGGKSTLGAGGAGGSISYLDLQSNSAHYTVKAGDGGEGAPAGDGGKLLYTNFSNRTPVSGIIKAADFTGDGIDDVLAIDAATGQMIINTQQGGNATSPFHQLVQYTPNGQSPVVLIDPAGVSPSDALVMDVNGDGKLDIVVAYKNSSSLGVYLNQGGGVFYDPAAANGSGAFTSATFALSFSPSKIATDGFQIAIAENRDGKSYMRYGIAGGSTVDDLTFDLSEGANEFTQPIADIAAGQGQFITAFTSGAISELQAAGLLATKPFLVTNTNVAVTGGIDDIEVDSTGKRLLVLSTVGHTFNVFDITSSALTPITSFALPATANPLVAHFVHDMDVTTEDDIAVLGVLPTSSTLTTYKVTSDGDPTTPDPVSIGVNLSVATPLKNFVPTYGPSGLTGEAALAGSMNSFTFTPDLIDTKEYPLPFASKIIEATAGTGGKGINTAKGIIGKGGAGGYIMGINADANEIHLVAGDGGPSAGGPAGAGGSVSNPASFVAINGATIVPTLSADVVLDIVAGKGGTPTGAAAKTATGGAGGGLSGLTISLEAGDITLTTGKGGDGNGGAAGAGGNITAVKTIAHDGNLTLSTGKGGDALSGAVAGGAGGSIIGFNHQLDLAPEIEQLEKPYSVTIKASDGGTSAAGTGGAGGAITGVTLKLDGADRTYDDASTNPPLVDANKDSTVRISVVAGAGGQGASGGAGGTISTFSHTSVFDQKTHAGNILPNYVVMQLTAGKGGQGTAGTGGAGGSIVLTSAISGVTFFDPDANLQTDPASRIPFIAAAGAGGGGSVKGGAGGSITGLRLQNSAFVDGSAITRTQLESAQVTAGDGGTGGSSDGGAGGSVSGALIGTQAGPSLPLAKAHLVKGELEGGSLAIKAGAGGASTAGGKGGIGGSVTTSTFAVVNSVTSLGMSVIAGKGGDAALGGGLGGSLSTLQISTPQSTNGISAILVAGNGGGANSNKATGGKGGDVLTITQGKDVNSSINLIQAGNGGANPAGAGGAGGSINGIKTVGFIGRPSDGAQRLGVFDQIGSGGGAIKIAQGLFAGHGGDGAGALDGINGAVANVSARQIAAIAAAVESAVDVNGNLVSNATGLFAAASKISSVKAALIGFDVGDGTNPDGTFTSTNPAAPKPSVSKPIDGFVFGASLSQVVGATASFIIAP